MERNAPGPQQNDKARNDRENIFTRDFTITANDKTSICQRLILVQLTCQQPSWHLYTYLFVTQVTCAPTVSVNLAHRTYNMKAKWQITDLFVLEKCITMEKFTLAIQFASHSWCL